MSKVVDVIVRGGSLTSSNAVTPGDLAIRDGRIVAVGDVSGMKSQQTLDAQGCYVLPGAIDVHTHPVYADDLADLGRAALHAGTTSVISYIGSIPAWGFEDPDPIRVVQEYIARWDGNTPLDFGLHVAMGADIDYASVVPRLVELGISSFKFFLTYGSRGMMVDDEHLIAGFRAVGRSGATAVVHSENGSGIAFLEEQIAASGEISNASYLQTRHCLLEAEAVMRVIALGEATECPTYIPHIAAADAWRMVEIGRERSKMPIWAETCPHYLVLNNDAVLEGGARFKIAPPLREHQDMKVLWAAVAERGVNVVASDHCGRTMAMKDQAENIFEAPYGAEGAEHLMPLVYSEGVAKGRMELTTMVAALSEAPADIFGLAPRKGRLAVGADADVVVLDPAATTRCTADAHLGKSDYCPYEGMELQGGLRYVVRQGRVAMKDGAQTTPGVTGGRYIARPVNTSLGA